ncbi:E3 binding domain-containing protein [Truepera radiovictrix]|uniref:E3 binding domain protein n=1 Tax=Truepera radiovictrix (strain DSM 17093 / CIP 108686 / LMG 22925 / RQ-24) TaxID=649638 RepID=D7CTU8_TRURR|nr:E3 binding domain-containing protein [Truepera radiovictrix]ADI15645.1 E3 binding domain protein [Truepera radiovictrix DSM 17093]WMT58726.1 E3 binding domain-containing protein [Truepera radiovictrix]
MSAPPIGSLARRLAEENNVDWRRLKGSGDGGCVLERDVLAYLAQVMRGEAPVDPTPEPLPEGLSAWPEELAGGAPEASPWRLDAAPDDDAVEVQEPPPQALVFDLAPPPAAAPPEANPVWGKGAAGVDADALHAACEEVVVLRARVAQLEEERQRHIEELHQLARLQETIDAQRAEQGRFEALQREVQRLGAALAQAQGEAARARELEAALQEREARLERARRFKAKARAEVERLLETVAQLEGELAALKTRPRWKFWG